MTRAQLEHIIRASAAITNEDPILVLGSQSILGLHPNPPGDLGHSMEADVCPLRAPDRVDEISGAIGEITLFQQTHGYYAHGLPPDACPLPAGWEARLIRIQNENTRGYTGLCLHPDDLACSKLAAGREKDLDFVTALLRHRLVAQARLAEMIETFGDSTHRKSAVGNLASCIRRARSTD